MHYLCTQCRKSVVIMGSDYEKIKTMEIVNVGGFNYIIVFSSNSDAIFMTHWLNLTFKKNLNEKWCSFQKFRLIQSGCLSDWGSSQAFENNASNFLSFWIGKCFICEPIYPWHFLTKSNRAVLKAIFITKGNSEQRSNYIPMSYVNTICKRKYVLKVVIRFLGFEFKLSVIIDFEFLSNISHD